MNVACYERWSQEFDPAKGIDRIEFLGPGGWTQTRPTFPHQPARLAYDDHGYESIVAQGQPVTAVRFTPILVGEHRYRALSGATAVEEGVFTVAPSASHGYVQLSARDPRYFAYTDGAPFCPIGLNLCGPPRYPLARGDEHFLTADQFGTLGCKDYGRWFRELARAGANYVRLWLSNSYFEPETEVAGELDLARFARLDRVVELAREHGIYIKFCLEHFRTFDPAQGFLKVLRHPADGRSPRSVDEWFQDPVWRELWLKKIAAYVARYGDDPVVMAWELWNEINAVRVSSFGIVREWTRDMLRTLKPWVPRQLALNSLGSFDRESFQSCVDDFKMDEMAFQQVHRYLDQGAPWTICGGDPVAFSIDAIQRARRPDRPVMLAETGAVNDRHTGPFRFYRADHRGIIFHDTTYPAFFAGAAGSGQIWHWEAYVDQKNLWPAFRPLADLVQGVQLDAEGFQTVDLSTDRVWLLGLRGEKHLLLWLRNKADSWFSVLRDEQEPPLLEGLSFDLAPLGGAGGRLTTLWPWPQEAAGEARLVGARLELPAFRYGLMVKIERI